MSGQSLADKVKHEMQKIDLSQFKESEIVDTFEKPRQMDIGDEITTDEMIDNF